MDNICISPRTLEIKVIDFGFATISQSEEEIKKMKGNKGTPIYSAPVNLFLSYVIFNNVPFLFFQEKFKFEVLDGRKCDVWSLGIMLYKMISSRYPFG